MSLRYLRSSLTDHMSIRDGPFVGLATSHVVFAMSDLDMIASNIRVPTVQRYGQCLVPPSSDLGLTFRAIDDGIGDALSSLDNLYRATIQIMFERAPSVPYDRT